MSKSINIPQSKQYKSKKQNHSSPNKLHNLTLSWAEQSHSHFILECISFYWNVPGNYCLVPVNSIHITCYQFSYWDSFDLPVTVNHLPAHCNITCYSLHDQRLLSHICSTKSYEFSSVCLQTFLNETKQRKESWAVF